jgi:hypothetical protein
MTGGWRLAVDDRAASRAGGAACRLALGDRASRPSGGILTAARDWIVESERPAVAPHARRPVIAIFGLAPRCGTTVVARSLAAALAAADPAGAATVWSADPASGLTVPSRSATRLAARLANVHGATVRAAGRLCIVTGAEPFALATTASYHGPVVLDGGAALAGGAVAAVADVLLLIGIPRLEPALAAVVASRLHAVPLIVLNRAEGGTGRWVNADHPLPESRLAAQLALGGREPRGAFGRAIRSLARGVCDMSPH